MKDGIYTDISITDYHANKTHLSATQLKRARKSLKEWKWYIDGKIEQPTASHLDFGNAFELALLSPEEFAKEVAVMPDAEWCREVLQKNDAIVKPRATAAYKEAYNEWILGREGLYTIMDKGPESWETIQQMMESCYADKVIQGLIRNTEYQLSLFWTDPETGIKLKTRPDICKRKKNVVVNVKTTNDASPEAFSRDLVKYDYPLQATVEITGCIESGLMDKVDSYFWLVCEKVAPFNAVIYEFTEEDRGMAEVEYKYLLNKIKKAEEEQLYPGYSDRAANDYGILKAVIPPYYYRQPQI